MQQVNNSMLVTMVSLKAKGVTSLLEAMLLQKKAYCIHALNFGQKHTWSN